MKKEQETVHLLSDVSKNNPQDIVIVFEKYR